MKKFAEYLGRRAGESECVALSIAIVLTFVFIVAANSGLWYLTRFAAG